MQKCLSSAYLFQIFLDAVDIGTADKLLVSKFQVCLVALPSALAATELARHPGLEIELNLLHVALSDHHLSCTNTRRFTTTFSHHEQRLTIFTTLHEPAILEIRAIRRESRYPAHRNTEDRKIE